MRQLNNLKFMAMAMLVALMSMSFTACSDDDDDKGPDTNSIVGVWERNMNLEGFSGTARIQFNSNKTGVFVFTYDDEYELDSEEYSFEYEFVNDGKDKYVTFDWTGRFGVLFDEGTRYDVSIMPSSIKIGDYKFSRK